MPQASCLCRSVRVAFPASSWKNQILCHCLDDRKLSGSLFTTNLIVSEAGLEVIAGTPRTYSRVADSGNKAVNYFCGNCGTTVYNKSSGAAGIVVIKMGTIDAIDGVDPMSKGFGRPEVEQFTRSRASWLVQVEGAGQAAGMLG